MKLENEFENSDNQCGDCKFITAMPVTTLENIGRHHYVCMEGPPLSFAMPMVDSLGAPGIAMQTAYPVISLDFMACCRWSLRDGLMRRAQITAKGDPH